MSPMAMTPFGESSKKKPPEGGCFYWLEEGLSGDDSDGFQTGDTCCDDRCAGTGGPGQLARVDLGCTRHSGGGLVGGSRVAGAVQNASDDLRTVHVGRVPG